MDTDTHADATTDSSLDGRTRDLVAAYDDVDDPSVLVAYPADAGEGELATSWIVADVDHAVDVAEMR